MKTLKRIVYVEDEPDIQVVARLALEVVGGFEVTLFSSGMDAVQKAAEAEPDLIILDVMMPTMDGPQTYNALKAIASLQSVPVVFMTAKTQPEEIAALKALGAIGVIAKPFDPLRLSVQLQSLWQATIDSRV